MAKQLTFGDMKNLFDRFNALCEREADTIPQNYLDRLEKASKLLSEFKHLPKTDLSKVAVDEEALEKAEADFALREQLRLDIEQHFTTCSYLAPVPASAPKKRGRKASAAASDGTKKDVKAIKWNGVWRKEKGIGAHDKLSDDQKLAQKEFTDKKIASGERLPK